MKVLPIMFLAVVEGFAIRYAYLAWFQPKVYLDLVHRLRERSACVFPFIQRVWTVDTLTRAPALDLWWARFVSLFVVSAGALALMGAIASALTT